MRIFFLGRVSAVLNVSIIEEYVNLSIRVSPMSRRLVESPRENRGLTHSIYRAGLFLTWNRFEKSEVSERKNSILPHYIPVDMLANRSVSESALSELIIVFRRSVKASNGFKRVRLPDWLMLPSPLCPNPFVIVSKNGKVVP